MISERLFGAFVATAVATFVLIVIGVGLYQMAIAGDSQAGVDFATEVSFGVVGMGATTLVTGSLYRVYTP